jgi:EAL domain-containing protein (putative c-di-GMP-specific phosphodiesterase class I)
MGWAARLRSALDENRFDLYAQPIVEIAGVAPLGYELLVRLREDGEVIPPRAFIAGAERLGLIEQIDRYVIRRAVAVLADSARVPARYHVNLSAPSVLDPELPAYLTAEMGARGVDPRRLTFEVAESVVSADADGVQRFARSLQDLGCGLAVDDVCAGFGFFSYLRHIPVQFLKIDGSLVSALGASRNDRVLVKAIIDAAHGMEMRTIAEHVGSEETRRLLARCGADYGQGYYLGIPKRLADGEADPQPGGKRCPASPGGGSPPGEGP